MKLGCNLQSKFCDLLKSEYLINHHLTKDGKFSQPARKIPWFTLVIIMHKFKLHKEMLWYLNQTHKYGWSRSMVLKQIAMKGYERSLIIPTTTETVSI